MKLTLRSQGVDCDVSKGKRPQGLSYTSLSRNQRGLWDLTKSRVQAYPRDV